MGTFGNYIRLLEKIDAFAAEIRDKHSLSFKCSPGCSTCCVSGITVWRVEFDYIRKRLQRDGFRITDPVTDKSCPFLDKDDHCEIYEVRPVVCRLWGTPLMIPAGHEHEWGILPNACSKSTKGTITCCNLNFTRGRSLEDLSLADAINSQTVIQTLAAINHVYCKKQGLDPASRYAISDICDAL